MRGLLQAAETNFIEANLQIALALANAHTIEGPGFRAVVSDVPHVLGNFAFGLSLDPHGAHALRELAAARESFRILAVPSDGPEYLGELLERAGFVRSARLSLMAAPGKLGEEDGTALSPAPTAGTKLVGNVFFSHTEPPVREALLEALERVVGDATFALRVSGRVVGTVSLFEHAGVLGIYSVGVIPAQRGRGRGAEIIRWSLAEAARREVSATLQCVPSLEPWYGRFGFETVGYAELWRLDRA